MDDTVKIICYGIGAIIALYIVLECLPYLLAFLALCGAWYLFQEYNKKQ
jgi:hypothetical protein